MKKHIMICVVSFLLACIILLIGGNYVGSNVEAATKLFTVKDPGGGTSLMDVWTDGKVGIGTTSPRAHLELRKTTSFAEARVTSDVSNAVLSLDANTDSISAINFRERGVAQWDIQNEGTNDNFRIRSLGAIPRLVITQAGNVGIGITNPGAELEVRSASGDGVAALRLTEYSGAGFDDQWDLLVDDNPGGSRGRFIMRYVGPRAEGPNDVLTANRNGNVGIGTTSPSKKLYVNGSAGGTQSWNASDRRWKNDIQTIPNALDGIMRLRGVKYDWKNASVDESTGFDDKSHYGVVAQEVENVFPSLVDNHGETDEYKHVEYNGLVGILIEAVKELKAENDLVKSDNDAIKSENSQLKQELLAIKDMVLALSTNSHNDKLAKVDSVQKAVQ